MIDIEAYRGSRKHVLEWVTSGQFRAELNEMLTPTGAIVGPDDHWQPSSTTPDEAELSSFGPKYLSAIRQSELLSWWLAHPDGAKTPTWDLLATCRIEGKQGLVLLEAKANHPELSPAGKLLRPRRDPESGLPLPIPPHSLANHEHIGRAIERAGAALATRVPGVSISRDRSYQVSNRLAFAWRATQFSVPTVLVFLGFIGDEGIDYVGPHFQSDACWQQHFKAHIKDLYPVECLEKRIDCGDAPMWVLLRSRPVTSMTVRSSKRGRES